MDSSERVGVIVARTADRQSRLVSRLILSLLTIWAGVNPYRGMSASAAAAWSVVRVSQAQERARRIARQRQNLLLRELGVREPGVDLGRTYPRGSANIYDVWNRPAEQFRRIAAEDNMWRDLESIQVLVEDYRKQVEVVEAAERAQEESQEALQRWIEERQEAGRQARHADQSRRARLPSDPPTRAMIERVIALAEQEVMLAARDEERHVLSAAPEVTYMRRIIHPERSRTGTCGLCVAAASRVYKKTDLLPLHARCNCTTAPVVGKLGGDGDPGFFLTRNDLDALYTAAGGTAAAKLKRIRVGEGEHGELGPILVPEGKDREFETFMERYRPTDDSRPMWLEVVDIAEQRIADGGTDAEIAAHQALAATASSHI